jgi:hypothetical protein
MIVSIDGLKAARRKWLGAGHDPEVFDLAANALACATSNSDVRNALSRTDFSVKPAFPDDAGDQDRWVISVAGNPLLEYTLHERDFDAEVTIGNDTGGGVPGRRLPSPGPIQDSPKMAAPGGRPEQA